MADKKGSLNADLMVSKVMENSLVRDIIETSLYLLTFAVLFKDVSFLMTE